MIVLYETTTNLFIFRKIKIFVGVKSYFWIESRAVPFYDCVCLYLLTSAVIFDLFEWNFWYLILFHLRVQYRGDFLFVCLFYNLNPYNAHDFYVKFYFIESKLYQNIAFSCSWQFLINKLRVACTSNCFKIN